MGFQDQIEGKLPNETIAIIGGLYALTEADVFENDRDLQPAYAREVWRRGEYNGQYVYFCEGLTLPDKDGREFFEVGVYGAQSLYVADPMRPKTRAEHPYGLIDEWTEFLNGLKEGPEHDPDV